MMWMYDIPTRALGVLVVALTVTAVIGGYAPSRRLFPGERSNESGSLAVSFIGMSAAMGLIFFSIVALDHPFADDSSVDPGPLKELLELFDMPAK